MKMEKIMSNYIEEILNAITDSLDKKFFVCSEYLAEYDGVFTGNVNENGFGNGAFIGEIGIFPNDDYFGKAYKDFESAVDYFEKSGRGYKVFHLKEGMKVVLENQQWIVNEDDEIHEEFFELYKKYWNKICENAKKFIPQNERIENLTMLADSLENVLEKN